MKLAKLAVIGWLLPGGAYLMTRRYVQFAISLALVTSAFLAGVTLQGGNLWPRPEELQGLDGFTALLTQAAAVTKTLAGGPYLLARLLNYSHDTINGHLHEYGTTLLVIAGILNLLALADSLDRRREVQS